ncbi:hypothetical protein S7335_1957 [Synechococcus sp. PCC 7335]|uniref:hypothetical protein n=1 Tax=Synechococcus sp. (strain ATCC 29403 / PCC 7335) TaxID=91464 RepID=UPI00017EC358|nr:hypothetical protein [Synechococcus sp. PCC 7335]EDX84260.1 hypothetical protein S7335_1957 [Synechococcus sp. PCC 7335]
MLLTVLALLIGYLTLSISTALLYSTWMSIAIVSGETQGIPAQSIAIAGICGLGFATLSGYLVGLVARRAPVAHAAVFSLMLIVTWGLSTFLAESKEPLLISILNIAIALVGAMTGGWIRSAQVKVAAKTAADPPIEIPK